MNIKQCNRKLCTVLWCTQTHFNKQVDFAATGDTICPTVQKVKM